MKLKLVNLFALFALSLLLAGAAPAQTRTYTIAPTESSFWVFVAKAGFLSALAHDHNIGVKSFGGKVTIPQAGAGAVSANVVSNGSLQLEIEAKSLVVLDRKPSEEDRKKISNSMHNEVLESSKHEKIGFQSAAVSDLKQTGEGAYSFTLAGDLALHGVTKRIAVPVTLSVTPKEIRATGQYTLRQTDFGIKPYSAAGGTVKVKNEVVIHFNIVAKS